MTATPTARSAGLCEVSAELLTRGYGVRFHATGSSMHPTIRDGEPITVVVTEPSEISRGDIVLYRRGRCVIAHRVVAIARDAEGGQIFVCRGDAADAADAPVWPQQILGQVVAVDRARRRIGLTGPWARGRQWLRAAASRVAARAISQANRRRASNVLATGR